MITLIVAANYAHASFMAKNLGLEWGKWKYVIDEWTLRGRTPEFTTLIYYETAWQHPRFREIQKEAVQRGFET